jgi:hypothetical protein
MSENKTDGQPDLSAVIKETKLVSITEIKGAVYNPRKIHPQKYKSLKKSIEKYGVLEPILVNKRTGMTIVSGHQRVRAATELGIDTIMANIIDVDENEEKIINIGMNNATGENEKDKLITVFKGLVMTDLDLDLTGFRADEINNLVANPDEVEEDDPEYPITPYFGEKYNYVLIFTKNEVDWTYLRNALGIESKKSYKSTAVGTSHVITFEEFEEKWNERRDS